jgi:hypothetical protein
VERKEVMKKEDELEPNTKLFENLISTSNLDIAIKNVVANKGSEGIDGMGVNEVNEYFMLNIKRLEIRYLKENINHLLLGE